MELEIFEALTAANVPADKARAAAASIDAAIDRRYSLHAKQLATQGDMHEVRAALEVKIAQAQAEIASERDRLIGDLRGQVVDLALAAAEKVVRENMDTDRNRRMIEDFINRAEVAA